MTLKINQSVTERELISQCRKQSPSAQQALYTRFSALMFSVCCRYIPDRLEAEGVMVQGFLKVFNKLNQFRDEGSFEGWVRRIMVNESLNYLRKNRNMAVTESLDNDTPLEDFNALADRLQEEDLLAIIHRLPPGYNMVFNLYAIEGYNHQEIADQLGISVNTSKSQLSRARALLQKMLVEAELEIQSGLQKST